MARLRDGRHRAAGPPNPDSRRDPQLQVGHPRGVLPGVCRALPPGSRRCPGHRRCAARPVRAPRPARHHQHGRAAFVHGAGSCQGAPQEAPADKLPNTPGVYIFRDAQGRALYIGTSRNVRTRVRSYFTASELRTRMAEMVSIAERIDVVPCAHSLEAEVRELRLIAEHKPRYNRRSRFPERAIWIKLTVEPFPRLSQVGWSAMTVPPTSVPLARRDRQSSRRRHCTRPFPFANAEAGCRFRYDGRPACSPSSQMRGTLHRLPEP